jgi:hypothetical protein
MRLSVAHCTTDRYLGTRIRDEKFQLSVSLYKSHAAAQKENLAKKKKGKKNPAKPSFRHDTSAQRQYSSQHAPKKTKVRDVAFDHNMHRSLTRNTVATSLFIDYPCSTRSLRAQTHHLHLTAPPHQLCLRRVHILPQGA